MKLFRTVRWNDGSGRVNHYVCINNEDELEMRRNLDNYVKGNVDIKEIEIKSVDSITELVGLSLIDLKKLLNNL